MGSIGEIAGHRGIDIPVVRRELRAINAAADMIWPD
jgi:hypothetical protein